MRSATSPENSSTKRRAGARKCFFFKQRIFCRCKGKTGECLAKIERWWRFWIAEDGFSKYKACSNQSSGWRIFCAFPAGCCETKPDLATVGACKKKRPQHLVRKDYTRLCLWQGQRRKRALYPDALEFSELPCSLLCASMRSFTSSSKERHIDGRSPLRAAMLKVKWNSLSGKWVYTL